jgi:hypothetical protein
MNLATYEPVLEKKESNHTDVQLVYVKDQEGFEEPKGVKLQRIQIDIPAWTTQALKSELVNAGYSVLKEEAKSIEEPGPYDLSWSTQNDRRPCMS